MAPAVAGVLYRAMLRSLRPPAHQVTSPASCPNRRGQAQVGFGQVRAVNQSARWCAEVVVDVSTVASQCRG
jgi:hypothetical protein